MLSTKYAIIIGVIILSIILYRRYEDKQMLNINPNDKDGIRNYLLNESSLAKAKKPILWIHVPYEYNSRNWLSFGSRSSMELNQPYLYLTVKSIIKNCEKDFHICIIDDTSFARVLPDWNIDMTRISDPILKNIRQLALAKLIYYYGGILTPIDFLCFRNLNDLYVRGTIGDKMFICENVNANITSTNHDFYPDMRFMGAKKDNATIGQLIEFMQRINSEDFTDESRFLGDYNRWINAKVSNSQINLIDGKDVGVKTMDDETILVDNLLSEDYINLYSKAYGIWIPSSLILNRTTYEWFARLSPEQVLQSKVILGKYFLLASAPDSMNGVVEQFSDNISKAEVKPKFVAFWKTPLVSDGIYGLKPNDLGNNLLKVKH